MKLYHTIELLFDFVTFRKIVKGGDDLVGFGKVMAGYQRGELDKLRALIKEFCSDTHRLLQRLAELGPFFDRAEQMFQVYTKDGNPLAQEERWNKFRALVESGALDSNGLKQNSLAPNDRARDDFVVGVVAYFIYRMRSSIAHSRIGEYLLTDADDDFVGRFGVVLIEEVVIQIFSSQQLLELVAR